VLATAVALLDLTHLRIGNQQYAAENQTYGLTTLHGEHAEVAGSTIRFQFRGKAGKEHRVDVRDRRLAQIIRQCQALPGQELFQYLDDDGEPQPITSEDVNEYLRAISGQDFTAKDFRTWAGTLVAACTLKAIGRADTAGEAKKQIVQAIKTTAEHLGNTPAICRKCYIHPAVLSAFLDGSLLLEQEPQSEQAPAEALSALRQEERDVLQFLRQFTPYDDAGAGRRAGPTSRSSMPRATTGRKRNVA
jgi:DNA topoisomerase-1